MNEVIVASSPGGFVQFVADTSFYWLALINIIAVVAAAYAVARRRD